MPENADARDVRYWVVMLYKLLKDVVSGNALRLSGNVTANQGAAGAAAWPVSLPSVAGAAANVNAPAVNTAAVVTYAAGGEGVCHVIDGVVWSYNADPTGGNLQIADGATVVLNIDIATKGVGPIVFPRPLKGTANTAMTITLAAAGAACTGKVSVLGKRTE